MKEETKKRKEQLVEEIKDKILKKGYTFCDMGNEMINENGELFFVTCFDDRIKLSIRMSEDDLKFVLENTIKIDL